MKHLIKFFGIILLFTACVDNTVYFDKPQPEGVKDLTQFPIWYRGQYLDKDSNLMTIDSKHIILKSNYDLKFSKQEIDSSKGFYIENHYLIERKTKEKFPVRMLHDSIFARSYQTDTILNLSNTNIVRKFKGNLILNYQHEDSWRVEILSLNWWILKHRMFNSKDLFNKLTAISNSEIFTDSTKKVTIKKVLKPTKKQFDKILSQRDSLLINVYKKI